MNTLESKGSPYLITERRVPELIPVLGSQPAGDVSHKPNGRLPLLSARPAVTLATLKRAATCYQFCCLVNRGTMGMKSLPKTASRQHCHCNLNPSAPESSTPTTRLPSHSNERNAVSLSHFCHEGKYLKKQMQVCSLTIGTPGRMLASELWLSRIDTLS